MPAMSLRAPDIVPITEARAALTELAEDAITGLKEALAGKFVADDELDRALTVAPACEHPGSRKGSYGC